ncbi:MAG: ABC transporter substrate-binding protein [Anaerolineales bacterium]|nr:ABC transporter substrate-binding protein [Anaerolineales bacterium]
MNLSKKFRATPKLLLYLLIVTGVLLASCSPQVVEVEKEVIVTQVVKEEVIVEKEVEVEVEVEVVKEVEVSKVEYVEVEVEAEAEPRAPVTFTYAHNGPIRTMDAPVTWYGSTHWLTNTIYECLIWRNWDLSGYHGQAAESWEALDDTTWRFHLRPGITFHNGEPLDAEAVKWNLDRVMTREDFLVHPQWAFISEVQIVDDVTVDVLTGAPEAYFEYVVSYNGCELLPPDYMAEVGEEEFAKNPVGSGPYQLVEFTASDRYRMEAWDDYHQGRPDVDTIIYQVIPDSATQVQAMITGDVDMMAKVPEPDRIKLASTPGIDLLLAPMNRMHHLYLRADTSRGAMAETFPGYEPATLDPLVRKAVSRALDRTTLAAVQGASVPNFVRFC